MGVELADTEFVLFLDDDAELLPGALEHLVAELDAHPSAGAVAPTVVSLDGRVLHSGGDLDHTRELAVFLPHGAGTAADAPTLAESGETGWVQGTAALIRRELLTEFEIDPGMAAYFEDAEWSYRVSLARPGSFRRSREALAVHNFEARPYGGTTFAARSATVRMLAACARFHERHGVLLAPALFEIMPELSGGDGLWDRAAARLLMELITARGPDWMLAAWMDGELDVLLDERGGHPRRARIESELRELKDQIACAQAELEQARRHCSPRRRRSWSCTSITRPCSGSSRADGGSCEAASSPCSGSRAGGPPEPDLQTDHAGRPGARADVEGGTEAAGIRWGRGFRAQRQSRRSSVRSCWHSWTSGSIPRRPCTSSRSSEAGDPHYHRRSWRSSRRRPAAAASGTCSSPTRRSGAAGLSNLDYAPLAEVTGRSMIAPEALNCSAPDTGNMEILTMFGTEEQKERWLQPAARGRDPLLLCHDRARRGQLGRHQRRARIDSRRRRLRHQRPQVVDLGRGQRPLQDLDRDGQDRPRRRRPTASRAWSWCRMDTPGVEVVRDLLVFGYNDQEGHCEVHFNDVRVPRANLLGEEGGGFAIAQARLGRAASTTACARSAPPSGRSS